MRKLECLSTVFYLCAYFNYAKHIKNAPQMICWSAATTTVVELFIPSQIHIHTVHGRKNIQLAFIWPATITFIYSSIPLLTTTFKWIKTKPHFYNRLFWWWKKSANNRQYAIMLIFNFMFYFIYPFSNMCASAYSPNKLNQLQNEILNKCILQVSVNLKLKKIDFFLVKC